jgi:hypothetical protein
MMDEGIREEGIGKEGVMKQRMTEVGMRRREGTGECEGWKERQVDEGVGNHGGVSGRRE